MKVCKQGERLVAFCVCRPNLMHLKSRSKACVALTLYAPKQVSKCLRYIISTGFTCLYSYKVNESVLVLLKK